MKETTILDTKPRFAHEFEVTFEGGIKKRFYVAKDADFSLVGGNLLFETIDGFSIELIKEKVLFSQYQNTPQPVTYSEV